MQKNKRLFIILSVASLLLIILLIVMVFTNKVNWSAFDFVIAGVLFFSFGIILEIILRKQKKTKQRIVLCLILVLLFFLIWVELAIGVFDSPFAGN